jgi:hypothetical protein
MTITKAFLIGFGILASVSAGAEDTCEKMIKASGKVCSEMSPDSPTFKACCSSHGLVTTQVEENCEKVVTKAPKLLVGESTKFNDGDSDSNDVSVGN